MVEEKTRETFSNINSNKISKDTLEVKTWDSMASASLMTSLICLIWAEEEEEEEVGKVLEDKDKVIFNKTLDLEILEVDLDNSTSREEMDSMGTLDSSNSNSISVKNRNKLSLKTIFGESKVIILDSESV